MSASQPPFVPRWASPPGRTISTVLRERGLSLAQFSQAMALPANRVVTIVSGREPISIDVARRLSSVLGGSVGFWIARDGQYREDLARVAADRWSQTLPINDMAALGWIDKPTDWITRIDAALRFFDVPDVDTWNEAYLKPMRAAHMRAAASQPPRPEALAAWLRQAEKEAANLGHQHWDRGRLIESLPEIRRLTTIKDPARFLPSLRRLCAEAGVLVITLRAPKGSTVSGAARFLNPHTALVALTARYLTDDHFWFTFFHEVGHIILDGPSAVYVDDLSPETRDSQVASERAADEFAASTLLTDSGIEALDRIRLNMRDIVKVAHSLGVAPGILIGQLQYRGRLGFGTGLNHLKRRYRWAGATLEMR